MTIDDNDSLTLTGSATLVAAIGTELTTGTSTVSSAVQNFYDDKADATGNAVANNTTYVYSTFTVGSGDSARPGHRLGEEGCLIRQAQQSPNPTHKNRPAGFPAGRSFAYPSFRKAM